jgi:5-methylcytosine-specific restriction endonuclease McrA
LCGRRNRLEVDHIIPARREPERAFDLDAVQTLCRACHVEKCRQESGRETTPEQNAWREFVRQIPPL